MSLEVPITLAPRYSVSVSLASPTGGALELLPPQTAIVAELQPILRGERGLDGAPGQDGQDGADANLSADIHAAPAKASPDDADELGYLDSAGSWALVKASWAQLKASLKTSFDTTYLAKAGGTLAGGVVTESRPVLGITQTWNNAAIPFVGKTNDFTDTASAAPSLVEQWTINTTPVLAIGKRGQILFKSRFGTAGTTTGAFFDTNVGGGILAGFGNGGGGWFFGGSDQVNFTAVGGSQGGASGAMIGFGVGICQYNGVGNYPANFSTAVDTILLRDNAANTLAQRNGLNPQTFRLYNTYTDGSNYERGFMRWNANVLEIGVEAGGTGAQRFVSLMAGTAKGFNFYVGTGLPMIINNDRVQLDNSAFFGFSDIRIYRAAANVLNFGAWSAATGSALQMQEMTAPAAPAANGVRIYAEDNGAGKTRLMALFATGAAVQIAIEP